MSGYGVIPYWVIQEGIVARMKPADARVFLAICAHVRARDWTARPGVATLAAATGLSERAVQVAVRRLAALGVLDVTLGGGRGMTNAYRLRENPACPCADSEGETPHARAPLSDGNPEPPCAKPRTQAQEALNAGAGALRIEEQHLKNKGKNRRAAKRPPRDFAELIAEHQVLDFPDFRAAWGDWITYRRELRKPLTPSTARRQLRLLAEAGRDAARQAIDDSISRGWQGLFPERPNEQGDATQRRVGQSAAIARTQTNWNDGHVEPGAAVVRAVAD